MPEAVERSFSAARDEAHGFFSALYGDNSAGDVGLCLFRGGKYDGSLHLPAVDLGAVAHEAVQAALGGADVYAATCLLNPVAKGRGTAEHAATIPGVWMDLDIAGPAHVSAAYPPRAEDWLDLLSQLEHPPTLVVDSGHGLYPWWLFLKPRKLLDEDARNRARRLVTGARLRLGDLAARHGWTADTVDDLARILRVPGTTNWKVRDDPRPVTVTNFGSGERYDHRLLIETWAFHAPAPAARAEPLPARIQEGGRTKSVTSLAGTMRKRNVVEAATLAAALVHNQLVCDPPLSEAKVTETVEGIYGRYQPEGPSIYGTNGHEEAAGGARRLDKVVPCRTRWLWNPFLPLGKLVIHAGEPGTMKSCFDVAIAAQITTGTGRGEAFGPSDALFLNFEDDDEDGLAPRLIAAGADLSRVHSAPNGTGPVGLAKMVAEINPLAVFVDPFGSWAREETDGGLETQVRAALEPLRQMAYDSGAMVKVNCHPNKQNSLSDALYRIAGSLGGMVGYARLVLASKSDGEHRFVAGIVKSNIGISEVGVDYTSHLKPVTFSDGVDLYPRVLFGEVHPIERRNFFSVNEEDKPPSKAMECAKAIEKLLEDGTPKFTAEIKKALTEQGYSRHIIDDGRWAAGVETTGVGRSARWALPRAGAHDPCLGTGLESTLRENRCHEEWPQGPPPPFPTWEETEEEL